MNIEKILYIIISTITVGFFIVFTFVFTIDTPDSVNQSKIKTIHFVDNISPAHKKVIDLFNKKYRGSIRVETINLSFDKFSTNERKELLARYLRSKNDRIDLFSVDQIWVPRFARWAVPLQNLLDNSDIRNITPNALGTCYYRDTLVAVPLYIDIAVLLYRDDLLRKLPGYEQIVRQLQNTITWEDFVNLGDTRNYLPGPQYLFQGDDYEGLICAFAELMAGLGRPIIDENGRASVNSPEGRKSLGLLADLVSKYKISPAEVAYLKENESFRYFLKNDGLFLRAWSSMIDDENEYMTGEIKKNLKIAPVPYFREAKPASVYGGWNLMVSRFTPVQPEVMIFVKFLLSEESQKIMFEEGGYLPINKKLYSDTSYLQVYPNLSLFNELYKTGIHRPFIEDYTNVSDILSYYINRTITGEMRADDALVQAEKSIREKAILVK